MSNVNINKKLIDARRYMDWSQAKLAEEVGVSVDSVRRWEKWEAWPRGYELSNLCQALGKTKEELGFSDDDKRRYKRQEEQEPGTQEPAAQQLTLGEELESNESGSQEGYEETAQQPTPAAPRQQQRLTRNQTPLFGREADIERICTKVKDPETRILTLWGMYGVGKTEVARQVGQAVADEFTVKFISLSEIDYPPAVAQMIGKAFGCGEGWQSDAEIIDQLQRVLQEPTLVVLDPFEHVTEVYPFLWKLLNRLPPLKMLVVSRTCSYVSNAGGYSRWLIPPDHRYKVLPLSCPNRYDLLRLKAADPETLPERLRSYDAVVLFAKRAQAFNPDFAITPANSVDVAEICFRLGGVPYTTSLLAEYLEFLTEQDIRAKLDCVPLFIQANGTSAGSEEPCTLADTLNRSCVRLTDEEKKLWQELNFFYEDFSLEAAAVVCRCDTAALIGGMKSLLNQGLLQVVKLPGEEIRYRILLASTEYIQGILGEPDELGGMGERYCDYYRKLLKRLATAGNLEEYKKGWLAEEYNIYNALWWSRSQVVEEPEVFGELFSYGFLYPRCLNLIPPSEVAEFQKLFNQQNERDGIIVSYQITIRPVEAGDSQVPVLKAIVKLSREESPFLPGVESDTRISARIVIIDEPEITTDRLAIYGYQLVGISKWVPVTETVEDEPA